jgi:hypothetical protein
MRRQTLVSLRALVIQSALTSPYSDQPELKTLAPTEVPGQPRDDCSVGLADITRLCDSRERWERPPTRRPYAGAAVTHDRPGVSLIQLKPPLNRSLFCSSRSCLMILAS